MTEVLYMEKIDDNYIKEFKATVIKNKKDYICLDKTAFYPVGGGQPADTGYILFDEKKSIVSEVLKKGNTIKHIIVGEKPLVGQEVECYIDWNKRYSHMRMHTAQHIISGVIFDEYNARTVGNQIHSDYSRVDFYPVQLYESDLEKISKICNYIIKEKLPVTIYNEERFILEKKINQQRCNLDLLPKHITNLRIVEIKGFDICPCAGTHVKNTDEIINLKIIKKESKGKDKERIIYTLN
jgi:misacylated tRNA(Ala) deacylase